VQARMEIVINEKIARHVHLVESNIACIDGIWTEKNQKMDELEEKINFIRQKIASRMLYNIGFNLQELTRGIHLLKKEIEFINKTYGEKSNAVNIDDIKWTNE